jgi:RHS repeat-associated protein
MTHHCTTTLAPASGAARWARRWAPALACALALLPLWAQAQTLSETRVTAYDYDANGFVTKEVIEPGIAQNCLQTTFAYDLWGNRTRSTSSACADTAAPYNLSAEIPRTSATYYSATSATPNGLFPTVSTNALGQSETRTYDPRFGVVTKLTGPNRLDTVWSYDNFGRKTKELRADGTYTTWVYKLCTDTTAASLTAPAPACPGPIGGATVAWVAIEQGWSTNAQPITTEKRQYYDTLDRVVRVQTQGFDGGFSISSAAIYQDTEYDVLGRVQRQSDPYYAGATAVWISYVYDRLDRVVEEVRPETTPEGFVYNAYTRFEYNGLVTKVTNSANQTKTTQRNDRGQVAKVTDHLGSTIAYQYDPFGNLLETNAAGSITRMRYDIRGNKTYMQDPAMGEWVYTSNVYGELVQQRDSMNQYSTLRYDRLGRMTERLENDLKSAWSYDAYFGGGACNKGIGKLCEAKSDSQYNRKHSYDPFGREVATTTVLGTNGAPVTVSMAYSATTSFVASKTWPTGYKASYAYTKKGYLSSVTGSGGGAAQTASYSIANMNERGQVTGFIHGNGTWGSKAYNAATGRLQNITLIKQQSIGSNQPASIDLLKLSYQYDSLSNLTKRTDGITQVGETFQYDGLNRLSLYTASSPALSQASDPNSIVQVLYDVRGNITYKSDVGQYWYDPARPNRMTAVTLSTPAGGQPLTGSRAMAYAFDDYSPGAQTVNGTVLGNGNLMYTVSQDTKNNRHTVRWEDYTSFNMPKQIKYASLVNTVAGVSTGASMAANSSAYTCTAGYTLNGANCTVPATPQCSYTLLVGSPGNWTCVASGGSGPATLICPAGHTLSKTSNADLCNIPATAPANAVYTCPSGYQLSGTQCKVFTNNATTGANSTSSDRTLTFVYGPEHQRISQRVELSPNAPAHLQSGAGTTWYFNGNDGLGLSYEREQKADNSVEHKHYVSAGGITFALATIKTASLASNAPVTTSTLSYLHNDHLGSIVLITDEQGKEAERLAYDPWGRRRFTNGKADQLDALKGQKTDRGYTEHEHLDEMGLIHMNGRVYDPLVGRFMSADPFIQAPYNLKSFNRYSYAWNNPLKIIDPTGYEVTPVTTTDGGSTNIVTNSPSGPVNGGRTVQQDLARLGNAISNVFTAAWNAVTAPFRGSSSSGGSGGIGPNVVTGQPGNNGFDPSQMRPVVAQVIPLGILVLAAVIVTDNATCPSSCKQAQVDTFYRVINEAKLTARQGLQMLNAAINSLNTHQESKPSTAGSGNGADNEPTIHEGQQGKHVPGHNNFQPGKSELTDPNPQGLLDQGAGTGQQVGNVPPGQPGSKERVDFGKTIGTYVDPVTGQRSPTSIGIIHNGSRGSHIVPARPGP